MNYNSHLPKNPDWWETYKKERGEQQLQEYANTVYFLFINMKPNSIFSIEKNVKEKNRDLFIKICCMFIDETRHTLPLSEYYEFSSDCTILRHIAVNQNKPLTHGNNRRTLPKDK